LPGCLLRIPGARKTLVLHSHSPEGAPMTMSDPYGGGPGGPGMWDPMPL